MLLIALWMTYTGFRQVIVNKACIEGNTAGTKTSWRTRRSRFNCWVHLLGRVVGLRNRGPPNSRVTYRIQMPPYSESEGMESTQSEDELDDSFLSTLHRQVEAVSKRREAETTERSWRASKFYKPEKVREE